MLCTSPVLLGVLGVVEAGHGHVPPQTGALPPGRGGGDTSRGAGQAAPLLLLLLLQVPPGPGQGAGANILLAAAVLPPGIELSTNLREMSLC